MSPSVLDTLAVEMEKELRQNILPYWPRFIDREYGGFYGKIENNGTFDRRAPKGLVMHARQLWVYAAAARTLKDKALLSTAEAAYGFLIEKLYDKAHKGFFWAIDHTGTTPVFDRKVIYGQAFAVYALAEYARSGGPRRALDLAFETYGLMMRHGMDQAQGGLFEACVGDWSRTASAALSDVDIACDKSMNTNLHALEALSSLYAASKDKGVQENLRALVEIHLDKILVSPEHLGLYFKSDWTRLDGVVSFGHDIEASWLITEAAEHAWDGKLPERIRGRMLAVAAGTARSLEHYAGTLPNELRNGRLDSERIWWAQAETIVGMVNAWELSGDSGYLERARVVWDFVKRYIVDGVHGEWFWGTQADGKPLTGRPKGGLWKAGYHDGRACMEIMSRAKK